MRKYRVAVIGRTGKGNYGHGLDVVWKNVDNVELVAVADDNEKGRTAAARRLGVKNAYVDYRQVLEKEKPQIVSVADRDLDSHRDMVVACARAGASVFLEKPMARTLAEAGKERLPGCRPRSWLSFGPRGPAWRGRGRNGLSKTATAEPLGGRPLSSNKP